MEDYDIMSTISKSTLTESMMKMALTLMKTMRAILITMTTVMIATINDDHDDNVCECVVVLPSNKIQMQSLAAVK